GIRFFVAQTKCRQVRSLLRRRIIMSLFSANCILCPTGTRRRRRYSEGLQSVDSLARISPLSMDSMANVRTHECDGSSIRQQKHGKYRLSWYLSRKRSIADPPPKRRNAPSLYLNRTPGAAESHPASSSIALSLVPPTHRLPVS